MNSSQASEEKNDRTENFVELSLLIVAALVLFLGVSAIGYIIFEDLFPKKLPDEVVKVKDTQVDFNGESVRIWFARNDRNESIWASQKQLSDIDEDEGEICVEITEARIIKKLSYSFLKTGKCI